MNCVSVVALLLVAGLCVEGTKPSRSCACTRLHFPVCGHDGQDYANPDCAKRCGGVGYRVGRCSSLQPCACPFSIQPVCGRTLDGTVRSFDNECQATCEYSATIVNEAECSARVEQPIYRPGGQKQHQRSVEGMREKKQYGGQCLCTLEFLPVCGLKSGKWTTYGNKCVAECMEVDRIKPGACGTGGGCACGRNFKPVCGSLDGTLKTYPNQCVADCQEAVTVSDGQCEAAPDNSLPGKVKKNVETRGSESVCVCIRAYRPVCASKDGTLKTYSNPCIAGCHGATTIYSGPCTAEPDNSLPGKVKKSVETRGSESGCVCIRAYRPVCASKDGTLKTYSNPCIAGCHGATRIYSGPCAAEPDNSLPGKVKKSVPADGRCVCTQEYVPVCGLTNGQWTEYPNRCTARCSNAEPILSRPCNAAAQLPVFPDDKVASQLPVILPAQLPVFPDDKEASQLPVYPDVRYVANLPLLPGDLEEDLVAIPQPVFPRIFRKMFQ